MSWVLAGALLLVGFLVAGRWLVGADPKKLASGLRYLGAAILALLALRLLLMGNLAVAVPMAAGALALAGLQPGRGFGIPGWGGAAARGPSPGRVSTVETDTIRMTLDHDSGTLDGEVLKGRHAGRRLGELSLDELLELRTRCLSGDQEAATLLANYLDRTGHEGWRARERPTGDGDAGCPETNMTQAQAYAVLGLEPGADEDEIKRAHRELMKKLHPDHGGTSYLASKVNQAKAVLLGRSGRVR
ncbi:MAG: DnaJ domain-containing protein [Sphingomonadales bacterium]